VVSLGWSLDGTYKSNVYIKVFIADTDKSNSALQSNYIKDS
jgi:hypothetical protein